MSVHLYGYRAPLRYERELPAGVTGSGQTPCGLPAAEHPTTTLPESMTCRGCAVSYLEQECIARDPRLCDDRAHAAIARTHDVRRLGHA